jgi:hypothetical protein
MVFPLLTIDDYLRHAGTGLLPNGSGVASPNRLRQAYGDLVVLFRQFRQRDWSRTARS